MQIELYEKAITDLDFWGKSGNKAIQTKIQLFFADMLLHPFSRIGKPEPLKFKLAGKWSRRITREHRIIYEVIEQNIFVYSLRAITSKQ
ncbi:Toxin YoeB [compost metagenome]